MGAQAGRNGAAHGARHQERADPAYAFLTERVGAQHDIGAGGAAGAGDNAGSQIRNLLLVEPGVIDGLPQCDIGIGRGVTHEAPGLARNRFVQVDIYGAADLAAHSDLGKTLVETDA